MRGKSTAAGKRSVRLVSAVMAAVSTILLGTTLAAPPAEARAITYNLDIPAEDLNSALQQFALVSNHKLFYKSELVEGRTSSPVKGEFTTEEAVGRLLAGTDLTYDITPSAVVLIREKSAKSEKPTTSERAPVSLHLAQLNEGAPAAAAPIGPRSEGQIDSSARLPVLEEIVVTAQKRTERLQDVPMAVTAISAATLVDNNQLRVQDYFTSVPGLSVTTVGGANQVLTIRGITTGVSGNPTVGVTIDDVPYGASTFGGGSQAMPDIDPGDLARIEVLRGPQGTLYGASSMGGLIKFVTVDPSTDAVSGRVQAGASGVYNGAEPGYNFRGSINLPLGDTVALRASAFTRQDPGYIDNPVLGINGINEDHVSGGRLATLWKPSDTLTLKLSAIVQDYKGDGSPDVDVAAGLGDLQQSYLRGVGGYERKTQAYSATLSAKLGSATLTAVSGYNVNSISESFDYTPIFGPAIQTAFEGAGAPLVTSNATRKFTQEVRLATPIGERIDWLMGAFYTHESSSYLEGVLAEDPATGRDVGQYLGISLPTTYQEYAAFTDLTFHITDRFDIQVGGRESHIDEFKKLSTEAVYGLPEPLLTPAYKTTPNVFTYLFTPRYVVSPDLLVYARLASGYRAGSPNTIVGVPPAQQPDKTQSYELGLKQDFLDRALSLDASVYYINWQNIQLSLTTPDGLGYGANASSAKSQGAELSITSHPLAGLTAAAWVSFNDAVLTAPLPPSAGVAASGSRLPGSGRFTANLSVKQEFPITGLMTGFVAGAVSYVGERTDEIADIPGVYPAYAKTDLHAGATYESWTLNLFVENLTDRRGVLNNDYLPTRLVYIQPRTVGLNLIREF